MNQQHQTVHIKGILKTAPLVRQSNTVVWVGVSFGIVFWIFSSNMAAMLSQTTTYFESLLAPSQLELWTRSFGAFLFIIFSSYIALLLHKRDKKETTLQASTSWYRELYDHAPDMFATVDVQTGTILQCNTPLAEATGYSKKEIIGQHISVIYEPTLLTCIDEWVFSPLQSFDAVKNLELRILQKDGGSIPAELRSSLVKNDHGHTIYNLSAFRDITHRKQMEATTQKTLDDNAILLKEIHHRVKNNLQLIDSLIELQKSSLQDIHSSGTLTEFQVRIHAMSLVHDQLYQMNNYSHVDLKRYLTELVYAILQIRGIDKTHVVPNIEIDTHSLALSKAMACGLIVCECITNALKHAFPNNTPGTIKVKLQRINDQKILLEVTDNGVGGWGRTDQLDQMGLHLIKTVAERQLNGTLRHDMEDGTSISVLFPRNSAS